MAPPPRPEKPRILLVAGEASGDRYGAHLIAALREQAGGIACFGIGGDRMIREGFEPLYESRRLAVVGLVEVLTRLPLYLRVMRDLRRRVAADRPDLAVLIDFPDFNLRLARHLKRAGIPVLYFVGPQVWAWRRGRVRTIAGRVDAMALILPFEASLYAGTGLEVEFVGHPLVDLAAPRCGREEARRRFGIGAGETAVGLLPGSRPGESRRILPVLLAAARILRRRLPRTRFLVPLADTLDRADLEAGVRREGVPVEVVEDQFYEVLTACDAAAVASGTATLEAALLGLPMVIVYRLHPLTHWIGSRLATVEMIGLANLVLGRRVVPELVQKECRPERVAAEIARLIDDPDHRARIQAALAGVRDRLGRGDAFRNTAGMALRLLSRGPAAAPLPAPAEGGT